MGSEWSTAPRLIVVHDPVQAGAFDALDSGPAERYLFRDAPDGDTYAAQHREFVATLRQHAARVSYLSEFAADDASWKESGRLLNQVFTRDSLITLPWAPQAYIPSRMRPEQRRCETATLAAAMRALGLDAVTEIPAEHFLEGGDVVPGMREGRRSLLIGYGPRTTFGAAEFIQRELIPAYCDEVIALRLADWRMNLDGGFLPLADDVLVADTRSILSVDILDGDGRRSIGFHSLADSLGMHVIDVTPDESKYQQACNAVCLGERRIVCYDLCPRVIDEIERRNIEVYPVPGSELVKGRGGPRCMTRPVY